MPWPPTSGLTINGKDMLNSSSCCFTLSKSLAGITLKLTGAYSGGNRSCISFFGSPSIPPNVSLGLLGVKNQTEPERIIYHNQMGASGAYSSSKGHRSQSEI